MDRSDLRTVALDALSHPLSVAAVGLLLINDHVLKSAMPGLITGKLSDFAGLFFFPFLATYVVSFAPVRRPHVVGFLGTAVWFLGIKLLPVIAIATESLFPWPSRITVDWTDLIALVALIPAFKLWNHVENSQISDERRSRIRRALVFSVASMATLATSAYEPPEVFRLEVVEDDVYAFVADVRLYIYRSQDHGETWQEIDEIEELAEGFPVVGHRTLSDFWSDNGVLTDQPVRCTAEDTTVCYLRQISPSLFQVSENGGITWRALQEQSVPELFEEGFPHVYLDWVWCSRDSDSCQRQGGDPRLRVVEGYFTLHEGAGQMSFDGGETWEHGWLPELEGRVPEGVVGLELTRCDPDNLATCYRPVDIATIWLRSNDGGITWSAITGDPPNQWKTERDPQLEGLVCLTDAWCFRGLFAGNRAPTSTVVNQDRTVSTERWRSGMIEETNTGGSTWHPSWTLSPRYGGHSSVPWLAAPTDLATVGAPKTVLVALGSEGIVRRTPDGRWETGGIGPVSAMGNPLFPWEGPRVALAWSMSLALLVFGTRLARSSPLVGSAVAGIAALMMVIYLQVTAEYPYGIAYNLISEFFFNGVPVLTVLAGSIWLLRRAGGEEVRKALVWSLAIGAVPVLLTVPWSLPRLF